MNRGQAAAGVRFLVRGPGYSLSLARSQAMLDFPFSSISMRWLGARGVEPQGLERLPGKVNYLRGADPAKWLQNVPTYRRVVYPKVYRGIDLVFHNARGRLEYDFRLAPNAEPNRIAFSITGPELLSLERNGSLVARLPGAELVQPAPSAYQTIDGKRKPVRVAYRVDGSRVSFQVGRYDHTRALVIDPQLTLATYLGGNDSDVVHDVAVHRSGIYVAGETRSTDFPRAGALGPRNRGGQDVFVAKLNRSGSELVYATYLGGGADDFNPSLRVTFDGSAYVAGGTVSDDFPTTRRAFQRRARAADAFVAKLDPSGRRLVFSTRVGGSSSDGAEDIAVGADGSVVVAGGTRSDDFPTSRTAVQRKDPDPDGFDAFVVRLSGDGSRLLVGTYVGGSGSDSSPVLAIAEEGRIVLAGGTDSPDFPTTPTAVQAEDPDPANLDVFVVKLRRDGSGVVYSTYLGGHGLDFAAEILADRRGSVYVAGTTRATDFPTTQGALEPRDPGPGGAEADAFVAKLGPRGAALVFSTYLGGDDHDNASDLAITSDSVLVVGGTSSHDFPTTADALQQPEPGPFAASHTGFVAKLDLRGSQLGYATLLGGSDDDDARAVAQASGGQIVVAGWTLSSDFPTTPGAFQLTDPRLGGGPAGAEGYVAILDFE